MNIDFWEPIDFSDNIKRKKMIFKEVEYKNSNTKYDWEEIPQEELWEDGEWFTIEQKD